MDRRTFLATVGAIGLAGCSSDGDGGTTATETRTSTLTATGTPTSTETATETTTETPTETETATETETETPTETETETATPEPASFEVVKFEAPSEVEIGESYNLTLSVKNTGEQRGEFKTGMRAELQDPEGEETVQVEVGIEPGETVTDEWDLGPVEYLNTVTYSLIRTGDSVTVDHITRTLGWGVPFTTPEGHELTTIDIRFTTSYSYESSGYSFEHTPPSGYKWAKVRFRAENKSGGSTYLPAVYSIPLLVGNRQYDAERYRRSEDAYEGGNVQAGVLREGWILYAVPQDVSRSDIALAYSNETYQGEYAVRWTL